MENTTQVVCTSLVRNKEGKFLFCKRADDDPSGPRFWDWPGGCKDFLEQVEEGLVRETKEETGLDVQVEKILWFNVEGSKSDDNKEFVVLFFLCKAINEEVKLSDEHTEYRWLSLEEGNKLQSFPSNHILMEMIINGEIKL